MTHVTDFRCELAEWGTGGQARHRQSQSFVQMYHIWVDTVGWCDHPSVRPLCIAAMLPEFDADVQREGNVGTLLD